MFNKIPLEESAVGKAIKVLGYVFISTGLAAILAYLQSHNEVLGVVYTGIAVAVINAVIVFVQKYRDPETPTLPK